MKNKSQLALFPPPDLHEYFILIAPSEEVKKETQKLKKKLYKMIGRITENEKSVAHISFFKTKWEKDKHVLDRIKKSLVDQKKFSIEVNGQDVFSHGTKKKTLFLKIENPKPIKSLFDTIKEEFKIKGELNPQLTIEQNIPIADFEKIQNDLDSFNYKNEWICDRITVLKKDKVKGSYKKVEEILLQ